MFVVNLWVIICWVRIDKRVGYEMIERGYETSEPEYESSGYERWVKPLSMFHAQVFSNSSYK